MDFISVAHAGIITDAPSISDIGTRILNFLLSVAGIIAIIALVLSGILYTMSNGDEKRMEVAKKTAQYAVLGVVVAMSGMVVIRLMGKFFSGQ